MYIHPVEFFEDRNFRVDARSCFVIMPFGTSWAERVYTAIKEVIESLGFVCRRGDDYYGRVVLGDVWRQVNEAAFIVADLTTENPHVYYELGIAHTLGKDIIPLLQNESRVPFDQQPFRILFYEDSSGGYENLRERLSQWISALNYNTSPQVLIRRELVHRFNEWRQGVDHIDLSNADFSGLDLSGINFADAILRFAILTNSKLVGSVLSRARMTSADLRGTKIDRAVAVGAHLSEIDMTGASLNGSDLTAAVIIRTNLTDVDLKDAVLVRANLSESSFINADLQGADLREGIWLRVRLDGADLRRARVWGLVTDRFTWERYEHVFRAASEVEHVSIEGD